MEEAVRSLCARALSDEELSAFVKYSVRDTETLDANIDEASCAIGYPAAMWTSLSRSSRPHGGAPGKTPGDLAPEVENIHIERVVEDEETGDEMALAWDDERGFGSGSRTAGM